MYIWGREWSGRGSGRVRLSVANRGSGRVNVSPGRVGSKKSDPWTTLDWFRHTGSVIDSHLECSESTNVYRLWLEMHDIGSTQRRSNIRTGSAAYFLLIGFLVNFLCIVAPPVGTRSRRVRFVFFYRTSYVGLTSRQWTYNNNLFIFRQHVNRRFEI